MIKYDQICCVLEAGGCLKGVWGFEEGVCGMSGRCLEGVWGCMRDVWGVSGGCLVCAGLINRESPKFTWSSLFLF